MLLWKIREMNRNGNKYPNTYTNPAGPGNEGEELKGKPSHPVESTCSHNSPHLWEDKQSSAVQPEFRRPKMRSPSTVQKNPVKEQKQQRYEFILYLFINVNDIKQIS